MMEHQVYDRPELAREHERPSFFVIDEELHVLFHSSRKLSALPPQVERIVHGLIRQMDETQESRAIAIGAPGQVVRAQQLEGAGGARRIAVSIERLATRNSVAKAVERYALTTREADVLLGLMRGASTVEMAGGLGIAESTVQEHIRKIGQKTRVTKRSEIVATVFGLR